MGCHWVLYRRTTASRQLGEPSLQHMSSEPLKIQRIDTRAANVRELLAALRQRLSPRGDVVSEAGRRRTIEVFGEPLSPVQVVERICNDVRERGGAAAYPSTVLMTVVPAQAAGVKEIAVVAPPTKFGAYNPDLLATCHALGVREVYRLGGAQGVAAMAFGVAGLPQVDKIVGPGNLFVALAKKLVFGEVDIDSIAGPSEVVVVADDSARADFTAADLIAQAEHAPGASVLITWSQRVLDETALELARQLGELERGDLARQSLEDFGALILVRDEAEAAALTNEIAPEHLHIATRDPESWLPRITCAGAIFLGHYTPVAAGDYAAGPSHVLPTGGTARFASGLSANDFLRAGSVIACSEAGLRKLAPDIQLLADKEGL